MSKSFKTYIPPQAVANQAMKGIVARNIGIESGHKSCATLVGVRRARQLSNREPVSLKTVVRMYRFFLRHYKNRKNDLPQCGKVAWLLWGGDDGVRWATKVLKSEGLLKSKKNPS